MDAQKILDEIDGHPSLSLSRWRGERFMIEMPDQRWMSIEIVEARGDGKVRMRFKAPADVRVWREEVLIREQEQSRGPQDAGVTEHDRDSLASPGLATDTRVRDARDNTRPRKATK